MTFDYIELFTIRSSLVYTQKKNRILNFDCLLMKIDTMLGIENEKPETTEKRGMKMEAME